MKVLRFIGMILALTILAALILGNLFPQAIRHWIRKDNITLEISDKNLNKLALQQFGDFAFSVISEKSLYHPYERIQIYGSLIRKSDQSVPKNASIEIELHQGSRQLKSIDGRSKLKLRYNDEKKIWAAYWYPERADTLGDITVKARAYLNNPEKSLRLENTFFIEARQDHRMIPKGLSLIGISDKNLISKRSILSAQAKTVSWTYIPSWMDILSADGILMLGGLTETYRDETTLERPWQKNKINETLNLADKVRQNGGRFGVWIKALEVEGRSLEKIGYKSSLKFDEKNYSKEFTRVSLLDKNRKKHVIDIINQYANDKSVDYIGLSHLFHTRQHDLELFSTFVEEFNIDMDDNWKGLDTDQQLAKFLPRIKDNTFNRLFNKWKNYAYYDYLQSISTRIDSSKTLFYFANARELAEFNDMISIIFNAGIDFLVLNFTGNFLEIQETIEELKDIDDFEKYYDRIVISYEVDIDDFEHSDYQMSAIENYIYANLRIIMKSSRFYQAQGLMINGLYRIMPGRRGPYPSNAWMLGFGQLIYEYQNGVEKYPLSAYYYLDYSHNKTLYLQMKNITAEPLEDIRIQFYPTKDSQKLGKMNTSINRLNPGFHTNIQIPLDVKFTNSQFLEKKQFLGIRFIWKGEKTHNLNNSFVNLLDIPVEGTKTITVSETNN